MWQLMTLLQLRIVCNSHITKYVCYLNNIRVGSAFVRLIILGVLEKNFVHVCAGVLEQLVRAVENDEGYLTVTQHTEFIGFLHQSKLPLCKSDLDKEKQRCFIKSLVVLEIKLLNDESFFILSQISKWKVSTSCSTQSSPSTLPQHCSPVFIVYAQGLWKGGIILLPLTGTTTEGKGTGDQWFFYFSLNWYHQKPTSPRFQLLND